MEVRDKEKVPLNSINRNTEDFFNHRTDVGLIPFILSYAHLIAGYTCIHFLKLSDSTSEPPIKD